MNSCKALMVQGTSSYCGKSLIVAALCRIFFNLGYRVAPFKAQNMSLNSFVTKDGREIARAQALQALAAGIEPSCDMNPILLKPKRDDVCQIVLHGRPYRDVKASEYYRFALNEGIESIKVSLKRLMSNYELIIIEGAGSPAEINLYHCDIANMRVAELANAQVLLVGDIDRGGVFASIVGTLQLLKPEHRALVKGLIINKFRGDRSILEPGLKELEEITGKRILGVIPYIRDLHLPSEDSVSLEESSTYASNIVDIAVIRLPHISNFTDFEPFKSIPGVRLRYVSSIDELDTKGTPDIVILPGTKNTIRDLLWLRSSGLADVILNLANQNVPIVGICGGYQMLGKSIIDKEGIEEMKGEFEGLGLLNIITHFDRYDKITKRVFAEVIGEDSIFTSIKGEKINGYEIHMGLTVPLDGVKRLFKVLKRGEDVVNEFDGAVSENGIIIGTYLHGIFDNPMVREALIKFLIERKFTRTTRVKQKSMVEVWDESLERLARIVKESLKMGEIYRLIQ
ncbi:MAG: cobyric acid synthase [Nitrososphaerota archaeon]|nr:cobyric acid synthase [Nitrososphaerales archaeon]MDW8045275.1 cobyric acid synthase [Nitrososphaerota archaeon]